MRKLRFVCLVLTAVLMLSGCGNKLPAKGSVLRSDVSIFPKQENGYVGDPMPFFDGEKMNVFYLHDARRAGAFHPWYLFTTEDFCQWNDMGVAIDVENDVTSPDYALGTGSVIKDKDGLFHAFYTGWNNGIHTPFTEKIQHATSTDLLNWTKIPEDGFYGNQNDFRDPYVYYSDEDELYYMLITSNLSGGVIRQYKSFELKNWTDNGIFFRHDAASYNMECPTFLHYNGFWYLSWSDQSPDGGAERVFRYRYKKNLSDNWIKPTIDYIDGAGFYAGRMEKFKDDRLLAFGWVPTKEHDYDLGLFNWGGNLVTHELKQRSNGELYAVPTIEMDEKISTEVQYKTVNDEVGLKDGIISFRGGECVLFEKLEKKPTKITFNLNPSDLSGTVKLLFGAEDGDIDKALSVDINLQNRRLEFYTPDNRLQAYAEIGRKDSYDCVLLVENECLTLYFDNQRALTTRIYAMPNAEFGFSADLAATISGLKFYE